MLSIASVSMPFRSDPWVFFFTAPPIFPQAFRSAYAFRRRVQVFVGRWEVVANCRASDENGGPYTRFYVSNAIKAAGRIYLDREISAHTLRHSFATEKIAKTHKTTAVSEYLGHSSVSTTLQLYNHGELTDDDLDL